VAGMPMWRWPPGVRVHPMSSTHLATFDGLVKRYGDVTAVEGLSLAVPEGTVCGLLGPNGAGKTTAIRVLLGLATPTAGSTTLLGEHPGSPGFADAVRKVGTLIEGPAIYARATPRQNMEIEASARKLRDPGRQIDELLALVGLSPRADTRSGQFSLGMKQRLGLALSLLGGPRLVVLDEPTNGLDPAGIVEIRELIKELPARGTSVLVCSHLLAEVELMCHRATIIRRGRLVAEGTIDELLATYGTAGFVTRVDPADSERAAGVLERSGFTTAVLGEGRLAVSGAIEHGEQISRPLAEAGMYVSELRADGADLEQVFLSLTTDDDTPNDAAQLPQLETIS
jgi:ABC-type multidrug transport system ATPase subunit